MHLNAFMNKAIYFLIASTCHLWQVPLGHDVPVHQQITLNASESALATSTIIVTGQTIGFPVEFDKENGTWKILEF